KRSAPQGSSSKARPRPNRCPVALTARNPWPTTSPPMPSPARAATRCSLTAARSRLFRPALPRLRGGRGDAQPGRVAVEGRLGQAHALADRAHVPVVALQAREDQLALEGADGV